MNVEDFNLLVRTEADGRTDEILHLLFKRLSESLKEREEHIFSHYLYLLEKYVTNKLRLRRIEKRGPTDMESYTISHQAHKEMVKFKILKDDEKQRLRNQGFIIPKVHFPYRFENFSY